MGSRFRGVRGRKLFSSILSPSFFLLTALAFGACGSSSGNGANGSNQIIIDGQIVSSAKASSNKNADSAPVSGSVTCTITAADSSGNVFFTTTATVQLDFMPGGVTPINGQNFPVGTFNLPDNPSLQNGFALSVECQKDGANFLQALVANYSGDVSLSLLSSDGFHVTVTLSNFFDFATSDETISFFESFSCFSLKILEPLTATLCTSSDTTTTTTADTQPTSEPSLTFCETISLGIAVAEEVVCGSTSSGSCSGGASSCTKDSDCPSSDETCDKGGCCQKQVSCQNPCGGSQPSCPGDSVCNLTSGCCESASACGDAPACDAQGGCPVGLSCLAGCCNTPPVRCERCDLQPCDAGFECSNGCCVSTSPQVENCSDRIDNDGDLLIDCKDPDCELDPACGLVKPPDCTTECLGIRCIIGTTCGLDSLNNVCACLADAPAPAPPPP